MKKYTIKKGHHYCQCFWLKFFTGWHWNKKSWKISFKFDQNCWWSPIRNDDDYDINKLYGIGFGLNHHKNSCRLGWIPEFDEKNIFRLFAYVYDTKNGEHISVEMGKFQAGIIYVCNIESKDNKYYFSCPFIGTAEIDNNKKDCKLQTELNFYHGGNNTAPKDENVWIEFKILN